MAYSQLPWRPFLGHQAWSWTILRRGNVFFYYVYKRFFYFCHVFYVLQRFYIFYFKVFLHLYYKLSGMIVIGGSSPSCWEKPRLIYWVRGEARMAEARGSKGRRRGWDSWGWGSQPPPHQRGGLWERCKLPQRGPGRSSASTKGFPVF